MDDVEMVQEFIDKFDASHEPDLWLKLIREEYDELETAITLHDAIGILDAICDLKYVLNGFGIACKMGVAGAYAEVHRSNLTKLAEDGTPLKREDGKILKGPHFEEPQLAQFLPASFT